MEEIAKMHRAIASLAAYLDKEQNEDLFFLDEGKTLSITDVQHQRLLEDETYENLINQYQNCGCQVVLESVPFDGWYVVEPSGIQFEDLTECFN